MDSGISGDSNNDMEKKARSVLAQKLRVLRMMRAWSQEDLAAASGLHRTYISLVERTESNISLDNLEKLANAFGIRVPELLGTPDPVRFGEGMLAIVTESIKRKEK